jgi:endoglucanase
VVLDAQFLSVAGKISELWHDNGEYSEAEVLRLWDQLLIRFATKWNLLALDIKNEPHGAASWDGNVPTAWNLYVERFIAVSTILYLF